MSAIWRLSLLACVLTITQGRRLLLGEDGFARVDSPSNSEVSGITVSSWVNITEFPGGVAPIVTMISEDASYQIAFFIREDGAGVLWGGPAVSPALSQDDYVDRQPRFLTRRKREAVDYSMGLGDVMNIMGPRRERSNTWTPMNFVDVSEMGVADLETSGSSNQDHYENWYDVGYELQMQESADPEPKIITKPSGNNDFVVINWNRPEPPPLSSNQWDPVGDLAVPETVAPARPSQIRAPENERFVWSQEENKDGSWTSQVQPVNIKSQTRNSLPPSFTVPPTTTSEPPRAVKSTKRPTRPFIPDLTRLVKSDGAKSRPGVFRYATRRPRPTTIKTTQSTTTTSTTTKRPVSVPSSQESRVPLWARLKKTSSEEQLLQKESLHQFISKPTTTTTTTSTTTTPRPTATRTKVPRIRIPSSQIPKIYKASASSQPRVTVRPPLAPNRRTTVTPTTSKVSQKQVSKYKAQQQRINSSKERKQNQNTKNRGFTPAKQHRPLLSHNLDEFKRILEGKPTVEDTGNKVVVYSMPITDVDHFNRMYDRYQQTEAKQNPRINLHVVYERAREGHHAYKDTEEERNQNQIEQISEPLPILTYKEEPLHYAQPKPKVEVEQQPRRENILRKPVLAEPIEFVPKFDGSSFKPLRPDNPYNTFDRDYSSYFPNVQRAEPIIVSEVNDPIRHPADNDYSVDVPLLSVAAAALSNLQNPLIYQPAILAEQDIGGQQAGFYQEPSRISHEQLPPEYMEKTKESKLSAEVPPVGQQIRRSYITNKHTSQNIPQPIQKQERPVVINEPEEVQPIRVVESIPIQEETAPEIEAEAPLNVNFRKMPYKFDANTWYHVTFTWSSEDHVMRIYINGELAGLLEQTIPERNVLPTTGVMLLGKTLLPSLTGFDPTSHLTGEMSNFVVWSEALTPLEVNNAFKCEASPQRPVMLTWSATPLRVYNDAIVKKAPPICGISS